MCSEYAHLLNQQIALFQNVQGEKAVSEKGIALYEQCDFIVYPSLESLWHARPCICRHVGVDVCCLRQQMSMH